MSSSPSIFDEQGNLVQKSVYDTCNPWEGTGLGSGAASSTGAIRSIRRRSSSPLAAKFAEYEYAPHPHLRPEPQCPVGASEHGYWAGWSMHR